MRITFSSREWWKGPVEECGWEKRKALKDTKQNKQRTRMKLRRVEKIWNMSERNNQRGYRFCHIFHRVNERGLQTGSLKYRPPCCSSWSVWKRSMVAPLKLVLWKSNWHHAVRAGLRSGKEARKERSHLNFDNTSHLQLRLASHAEILGYQILHDVGDNLHSVFSNGRNENLSIKNKWGPNVSGDVCFLLRQDVHDFS